ncbi:MAG: hypothetical protein QNJ60_10435 [Xenococcaceae cyanobacterium MO_188.B19]|nr:hypothetical protein [Xenococcaceae cyanobacterium MO_188.B19]
MKKPLLISLLISLAAISVNAQAQIKGDHAHSHHDHEAVMISNSQPVPSVDLVVHEDSMKGWNLQIKLNNFEFVAEMVNQENELNKGHAHLYINDKKITRIYGNWYYLGNLPPGRNEVKVELTTNSHQGLMYQGNLIGDTEIIEVKAK